MSAVVISGVLLSSLIYLAIGFSLYGRNKTLGDLFPIIRGKTAKIHTVDEFASSTTATTISLATIVLAYFELAGYFGIWLLWTAFTTFIGILIVQLASKKIWLKLSDYSHKPSMHEFIGTEFNSKKVALIASICTSIGFLLVVATELIVGSRFIAGLVPQIPEWITVVFLSLVGFVYTLAGGFRAVIKTDQVQMKFIWGLIIFLGGYYIYHIFNQGGLQYNLSKIPDGVFDFSNKPGLGFFLFGIAVLNIPGFISNMSVWQRISGADNPEILEKGIRKSLWGTAISWSLLVLLACFAFIVVTPTPGQSLLTELLVSIGATTGGKFVLFFVVVGLLGAMLSTASTNLIVLGHTISEDIIAKFRKIDLQNRIDSRREIYISRLVILFSLVVAVFLVEGLKHLGFSIADLVFAIYGSALALFPLIIAALYVKKEKLTTLATVGVIAAVVGFASGWGAAIYGREIMDSNLIFLAPGVSLITSSSIVGFGVLFARPKGNKP